MASRGTTWAEDEVKVLLEIWGDKKLQNEFDGAKRKHPLHEKIAKELSKRGYSRDAEQIKTKLKNLKSMYRTIKDHNNKTGNEKKTGQFYDELDDILGHRPTSAPPVILDTSAGGLAYSEERENDDEDAPTSDDKVEEPSTSGEDIPKKRKQSAEGGTEVKRRRSRGEKVMQSALKDLKEMQMEAEKRFREWEEEQWKRETEMEERRRREDRDHERRMLQMILEHGQQRSSAPMPNYTHSYQHPMYQPFNNED